MTAIPLTALPVLATATGRLPTPEQRQALQDRMAERSRLLGEMLALDTQRRSLAATIRARLDADPTADMDDEAFESRLILGRILSLETAFKEAGRPY